MHGTNREPMLIRICCEGPSIGFTEGCVWMGEPSSCAVEEKIQLQYLCDTQVRGGRHTTLHELADENSNLDGGEKVDHDRDPALVRAEHAHLAKVQAFLARFILVSRVPPLPRCIVYVIGRIHGVDAGGRAADLVLGLQWDIVAAYRGYIAGAVPGSMIACIVGEVLLATHGCLVHRVDVVVEVGDEGRGVGWRARAFVLLLRAGQL